MCQTKWPLIWFPEGEKVKSEKVKYFIRGYEMTSWKWSRNMHDSCSLEWCQLMIRERTTYFDKQFKVLWQMHHQGWTSCRLVPSSVKWSTSIRRVPLINKKDGTWSCYNDDLLDTCDMWCEDLFLQKIDLRSGDHQIWTPHTRRYSWNNLVRYDDDDRRWWWCSQVVYEHDDANVMNH